MIYYDFKIFTSLERQLKDWKLFLSLFPIIQIINEGRESERENGITQSITRKVWNAGKWEGDENEAGKKECCKGAREGLTIPGCRNVWTCGANHEFIANSLRIFQVISSVMSKGYASDDERVRCHGGTKVNHLQFNIFSLFHLLSFLSLSSFSFSRPPNSNPQSTIHPPYMD